MTQKAFEFLTKEDFNLLVENADRLTFQKNELILAEGSRRQAIFILLSGTVRIERMHAGKAVAYVTLGPGQIFGEMSFVENQPASASVLAEDHVELHVVEGHQVNGLLASVPGFGTRFYQSVALILANRLRSTSKLIPSLMMEEASQARPSDETDALPLQQGQLPPELATEALRFRREMLQVDRGLKEREIAQGSAQDRITKACDRIKDALSNSVRAQPNLAKAIGGYVFRETFPFFVLSKRFDRLYTKPKGYTVDFRTIELLNSGEPEGSGRLGALIDAWLMNLPFRRAFVARRTILADVIRNSVNAPAQNATMLIGSLAGGASTELLNVCAESALPSLRALCIDADSEALNRAAKIAAELGVSDRVILLQENVLRLSLGKGQITMPPQNMIYCAYLFDYLEDDYVVRLLNWVYDHLAHGGTAVGVNFQPSNSDKLFLDYILDWRLTHRTETQLRDLFHRSGFQSGSVEIRPDDTGAQLFAFARKL